MSSSSRPSLTSQEKTLGLREILSNLSTLEIDVLNPEDRVNMTADALEKAKDLMEQGQEEQTKFSSEYIYDARVLHASSNLAVGCARAFSSNVNVYNKHELARHIKEHGTFWSGTFPLEAPPCTFVWGAASEPPPPRTRAPRRRPRAQPLATLTAPAQLNRLDKTEESSEMVEKLRKFIIKKYKDNNKEPINYFNLVINPSSFTATIENVYRLSFLVQDVKVSVNIDEDTGLPMVRPLSSSEQENVKNEEANQFIVSLDMKLWKNIIEAFHITEPMLQLS